MLIKLLRKLPSNNGGIKIFLLYLRSNDENVQHETFEELERNDVGDEWVLPAADNIFLLQGIGAVQEKCMLRDFGLVWG